MHETEYRAFCAGKTTDQLIVLLARYEGWEGEGLVPSTVRRKAVIENELSDRGMTPRRIRKRVRHFNAVKAIKSRSVQKHQKTSDIYLFFNIYTMYLFSIAAVVTLGWLIWRGVGLYEPSGPWISAILFDDPMLHDIFVYGPIFGLATGWVISLIPIRLGVDLRAHGFPLPLYLEERTPPRTGDWWGFEFPWIVHKAHLVFDALFYMFAQICLLLYLFHYLPEEHIAAVGATLFFSYMAFFIGLRLWARKGLLEEGEHFFGPIFTPLQLWLLTPCMILFAICIALAVTMNQPDMKWNTFSISFEIVVIVIAAAMVRSLIRSIRKRK